MLEQVAKIISSAGLGKIPFIKQAYHVLVEMSWLLRRRKTVKFDNSFFYCNPHEDEATLRATLRGHYFNPIREPLTLGLFRSAILPGMTIIDCGACIGDYSLIAAERTGKNGCVISIEPHPVSCAVLLKNKWLNKYSCIEVHNCAVAEKSGKVRLYLSGTEAGCHTLAIPCAGGKRYFEVCEFPLDEIAAGRKVDIIKMDVEGAEWRVFQGMNDILKNNQQLIIFMEFYPHLLQEMGADPGALLEFITKQGFIFTLIDELGDNASNKIYTDVNALQVLEFCGGGKAVNLMLERK